MEDKRAAIDQRTEESRKRETRAWILAGFVLHQIAEDSRKAAAAVNALRRKD